MPQQQSKTRAWKFDSYPIHDIDTVMLRSDDHNGTYGDQIQGIDDISEDPDDV